MGEVLALAAETLCQVLLRDVTCVVDIEVMEGEGQISLSDGLPAIDGDGQEFRIIDLTVMVEVDALEDLVDFLLGHLKLVEGGPDLVKVKIARVVCVKGTEGITELGEIESAGVDRVYKEGQGLDLETFWRAEVFNTAEHLEFGIVGEVGVVAGMVHVDIIS